MNDSTPTPVEAPGPEAEPSQASEPKKKRGAALIGCLVVLALIVIIVLLIVWSRGCTPRGTSSSTGTQPSAPSTTVSTTVLEGRIHAALHAKSLPNGSPLDTLVYIFVVSPEKGVTITLTPLDGTPGARPSKIASDCENAVMTAVPEVTSVTVVGADNKVISVVKR